MNLLKEFLQTISSEKMDQMIMEQLHESATK